MAYINACGIANFPVIFAFLTRWMVLLDSKCNEIQCGYHISACNLLDHLMMLARWHQQHKNGQTTCGDASRMPTFLMIDGS